MASINSVAGRTIALTGAGSGIGRALARLLAEKGAKLALADRDADGLAETAKLLGNYPHSTAVFDVTDPGALEDWVDAAAAEFGGLDGIINNAGLSVVAPFEHCPPEEFDRVMAVNFDAVMRGCRAALPHLIGGEHGWIVNVSSVFGMMGYPTQTAYNASKYAVRGFTEALHLEMQLTHPEVQVVRVHPGGIKTRVAHNSKFIRGLGEGPEAMQHDPDDFLANAPTTAEQAAETIVRGMERGEHRVLIGKDARMVDYLTRLFPVSYWKRIGTFLSSDDKKAETQEAGGKKAHAR
ncbi:short-chain dehydrogenase [Pacificimonas flava]|uniref:Short-chain dehydrogenase n=2 Tax=Pacificimonas TaxID=1960290 RepID=A0A219B339_9SPHN|nr:MULTISPECIES: SDR family oxidoreductase [Pacificimonas]MBZ6377561.1 SDR family oxidoreductase [Pacificimonas aurantium]OWV32747.1 short-chain dehydrogenase [Pacificimonas flava]